MANYHPGDSQTVDTDHYLASMIEVDFEDVSLTFALPKYKCKRDLELDSRT